MKKLFAILAVSAVMTACNNSSDDQADVMTDSVNTESPLMDAVNTADSAVKKMEETKDTMIKVMEATKEVINP